MNKTRVFSVLSGAVALLLLLPGIASAAGLSGAIFTTDKHGHQVNGNIYTSRQAVYLNGGPQPNAPCTAAGLPDGDYYFQVTDPAGKVLLSLDSIDSRKVHVSGGVISSNLGTHRTGTGKCAGSITIQLMPYKFTPNPGYEYKVWMTPTSAYDPNGGGSFGFLSQSSKTDNFKVDCDH